ncbi:MerR family transcriptional regulator [Leptolyngbya sp. NK1-12]|uniref:MerR family transcriptional regulator n=1 Tax=Leptolyngbya sp. NK1-12 TaxID=2547451 RepID=A0AA97AHA7_9CYAN|nr:precorrin-8X methylmutase [Elainella sp. C42_A2020_010]WNZ25230.1 MerR family transcriptional regulator [Leptolyngbya sp. NK1-12]
MSYLTIKELTDAVGNVTPRMVRHYHKLGLLPSPKRSRGNYRLYTSEDVQRLRRIVALKQQGFQLSHIQRVLEADQTTEPAEAWMGQLQQQYQTVMQQMVRLRRTATALEGLLGRDRHCQSVQAEALAQLRILAAQNISDEFWEHLDAAAADHPESFADALQKLLPDLSDRSEIEVDLLSQLVLACGDVSLVAFVRLSDLAIKAAREALKAGCQIVTDVPVILSALDQVRLAHLGCQATAFLDDPHISTISEAETLLWQKTDWSQRLKQIPAGCIWVVGYAPSMLMGLCQAIEANQCRPALVIGMPIGFSHAPAAKRRLQQTGVEFITTSGPLGGGLLAAVALNALVRSLLEKPHCHCYLKISEQASDRAIGVL